MSKENASKKEEALRQIHEIKNHLVDKQTFFPYNYHATYVWSAISAILTMVMVSMYETSILQGTVVVFILIALGFVTEGILTKKINESYDIEDCTLRQQFIVKSFCMLSLFLIVFSAILAGYKLYVPIFLSWLFLVSLVYFAVGFVLNIGRFTQMAMFNMSVAILLLAIGFINGTLLGESHTFLHVTQIVMLIGLTMMPAIVAWQQIKEGK